MKIRILSIDDGTCELSNEVLEVADLTGSEFMKAVRRENVRLHGTDRDVKLDAWRAFPAAKRESHLHGKAAFILRMDHNPPLLVAGIVVVEK